MTDSYRETINTHFTFQLYYSFLDITHTLTGVYLCLSRRDTTGLRRVGVVYILEPSRNFKLKNFMKLLRHIHRHINLINLRHIKTPILICFMNESLKKSYNNKQLMAKTVISLTNRHV